MLTDFIGDGLNGKYGQPWDQVDRAAAFSALLLIVQDIEKGTLNGKPYNPLAKTGQNSEALKEALAFYMGREKTRIVRDINNTVNADKGQVVDAKLAKAVSSVMSTEQTKLDNFCKNSLEPFGVKLEFKINTTSNRGYNGVGYPNHNPSFPANLQTACKNGRTNATASPQGNQNGGNSH